MMSILNHMVVVGAALFGIGLLGLLIRRNVLIMLMCIELMLNGANLTLVSYARAFGDQTGHVLALVVIAVAAAEVGIGFGIVLSIFRRKDTLDVGRFRLLNH
jgi:NADH-quinone oxidoreductase subunit K